MSLFVPIILLICKGDNMLSVSIWKRWASLFCTGQWLLGAVVSSRLHLDPPLLSVLTFCAHRGAVMFLKQPFSCALLLLAAGRSCLAARPLLAFLIDGFRHDYMDDLQKLPGFRELVVNGVKVDYMTPDFPSLSFPNYYTLMTGNQSLFTRYIKAFSFITLDVMLKCHLFGTCQCMLIGIRFVCFGTMCNIQ